MNRVSCYRVPKYDLALLKEAVEKIIADHGGYERLFAKGKRVVIKPNLVVKKKPDGCATTHPALLEAVILCLLPYTRNITVAECPGGPNTEILLSAIYRETGIQDVCKRHKTPIYTAMTPTSLKVPNPQSAKELEVLDIFAQADVFINLSKMKTHSLTTVTGCAKNLYGTIPGLRKVEYHAMYPDIHSFAGLICDLNQVLIPTLSITDGIWGMEKDGPSGGIPKYAGALLGGVNTHAIDEIMCCVMGIDPELSPVLQHARRAGFLNGEVTVLGENPDSFCPTPFLLPDSQKRSILRSLPNLFGGRLVKFLSPKPKINLKNCIGCGECARLCPQKTIVIKNKKAIISHKKCIRCWCCQEMCPKKAVETHSLAFLKFI